VLVLTAVHAIEYYLRWAAASNKKATEKIKAAVVRTDA
jgi:hypothetical protein